jgi:hypothetical protein
MARPSMNAAIAAHLAARKAAADARDAPAVAARAARATADAALYGTPAWDALPGARRVAAQRHALTIADTTKETPNDAA